MKMDERQAVRAKHAQLHKHAEERGHKGLFMTLTLPARFHAHSRGAGGQLVENKAYAGATPRQGHEQLRQTWARARAAMQRRDLRVCGMRVAEPHSDGTPHWNVLLWAESDASAAAVAQLVRNYWQKDEPTDPRVADRVLVARLGWRAGLGYVDAYLGRSAGASAWAATWGIGLVSYFGLPMDEGSEQ